MSKKFTSEKNSDSDKEIDSSKLLESTSRNMEHTHKYRLVVRQHPVHARLFGSSNKDRRPIDPPPILELLKMDHEEQLYPIIKDSMFFCMRVELWNSNGTSESCRKIHSDLPLFVGSQMENSRVLTDDLGRIGTFFIFKDLSVRDHGTYTLKFFFFDLESMESPGSLIEHSLTAEAVIFSNPFNVSTAREFSGVLQSSNLAKVFKSQGVKLSIKK
ncbi:hypothetical protein HK099_005862 [Clydaea vesicula]|uniref:Velvet domain-containing protein n=1 Tax=Clydaea vesicula TaxID=447962 RepID=A0AAD5XZD5_9FUNG|nr:hypothetical protein HK099_005862 [Clydaea vesicula]